MKNMGVGGVEQFIMNQYRVLASKNVVFDFCVYGDEENVYEKEIRSLGGSLIPHPLPNNSITSFSKKFRGTLRKGKYDVVHCHQNFFSGIVMPLAKKEKVPVRIAHAHTTKDMSQDRKIRQAYLMFMRWSIHRNATHQLGASPEACQFLFGKKAVEKDDAQFFPNAIVTSPFLTKTKPLLRKKYGIPENAKLFGHIGRFKPSKNHLFLLSVFKKYREEDPTAHLILVGDGPDRLEIEKKVKALKLDSIVHFLGNRLDIAEILHELDLFLFPSLYEGLGISLIEAQAAGIKSVVSDVVPKEADLKMGLIDQAPLADEDQWITQIKKTLKKTIDPQIEHSAYRKNVLATAGFDSEISALNLLDIYRKRV